MKKSLMLFLVAGIISTLLVGCRTENVGDLEETQKIEIISSDDSSVFTTISDNKDIENFVDALKMDDWESVDLPTEAIEGKTFKFYQKSAAKLNLPKKQKDNLNEVATMTTYENVPYIKFNLKKISFNFKVPKKTHEYLNSIEM